MSVGNVTSFTVKNITKNNFLFGGPSNRWRREQERRQLPGAEVAADVRAGARTGPGGRPPPSYPAKSGSGRPLRAGRTANTLPDSG